MHSQMIDEIDNLMHDYGYSYDAAVAEVAADCRVDITDLDRYYQRNARRTRTARSR